MARIVRFPDRPPSPASRGASAAASSSSSSAAAGTHAPSHEPAPLGRSSSASQPSSTSASSNHPRSGPPPPQTAPPRAQRFRTSLPPVAAGPAGEGSTTDAFSDSPSPSPTRRPAAAVPPRARTDVGAHDYPPPPPPAGGQTIYDAQRQTANTSSAPVTGTGWPSFASVAPSLFPSASAPAPPAVAHPPTAAASTSTDPALSSRLSTLASLLVDESRAPPFASAPPSAQQSTSYAPTSSLLSSSRTPGLSLAPAPAPVLSVALGARPSLATLPLSILSLIRTNLSALQAPGAGLDGLLDHVALSRSCAALAAFYHGPLAGRSAAAFRLGEPAGWWVIEMERCGFGLPSPVPDSPVSVLVFYLRHLAVCRTEVLRPWLWAAAHVDQTGVDGLVLWSDGDGGVGVSGGGASSSVAAVQGEGAGGQNMTRRHKVRVEDLRGEWVRCCTASGGVWPPTADDILSSSTVFSRVAPPLFPHPLLSDIHLPLSPPPPPSTPDALSARAAQLDQAVTLYTAEDDEAKVGDHPGVAYQSATWPPARRVAVAFAWRKVAPAAAAESSAAGPAKGKGKAAAAVVEEWEEGRAHIVVERREGEGPVTIADFLQGVAAYWSAGLSWEETKRLRLARPEIDTSTADERKEKGSLNKRLGKIRREYGRWGWLGAYTILTGFHPSTAADPTTLTGRLTTEQKYRAHYPADDDDDDGDAAAALAPAPAPATVGSASTSAGPSARGAREASLSRGDSGYGPSRAVSGAAVADAQQAPPAGRGPPSSDC